MQQERPEFEEDDPVESFLKHREKEKAQEAVGSAPAALEYDSDDNPILEPNKKKVIESLAPLDHASISYEEFEKNFYEESEEIAALPQSEIFKLRKALGIRIDGDDPVRPVRSFAEMGLDVPLLNLFSKLGFTEPTPIQKQTIPAAMAGRDLIGIAKTGSGKTAAYVVPMLVHILDQRELKQGEGPIAIVAAPTRELAHQIHSECVRFGAVYGIRSTNLVGGLSKGEQWKSLKSGCGEIVVCTPGRLIDMIRMKAIKPIRTTMLVLDEADKMFEMGFEPQVRSIVGQIRPDRQTLLFSATFGPAIEDLAREVLVDPLRVTVGSIGAVNEDVTQIPIILHTEDDKWRWLAYNLPRMLQQPDESVLIFGSTKGSIDLLASRIALDLRISTVSALHGDKDMNERLKIMHAFKTGVLRVLVATDVAARGLDVKSVRTVVNYHLARDVDSHTHRIGRTGRAGVKGVAFSLLLDSHDAQWAGRILNQMRSANQDIPPELHQLAMRDGRFKKGAQRRTRGGGRGGMAGRRSGPDERFGFVFSGQTPDSPAPRANSYNAVPPPSNYNAAPVQRFNIQQHPSVRFEQTSTAAPLPAPARTPEELAAGIAKFQAKFQTPM